MPDDEMDEGNALGALLKIAEAASLETEILRGKLLEMEAQLRSQEKENNQLKDLLQVSEKKRADAEASGHQDMMAAHAKEMAAAVQEVKTQYIQRERDRLEAGVSSIVSALGQIIPTGDNGARMHNNHNFLLPPAQPQGQPQDELSYSFVGDNLSTAIKPPNRKLSFTQNTPTNEQGTLTISNDNYDLEDRLTATEAVASALLARAQRSEMHLVHISHTARIALTVQRSESVAREAARTAQLSSLCAVVAAAEARRAHNEEEAASATAKNEQDLLSRLRDAEDALRVLVHADFSFERLSRDACSKLTMMEDKLQRAQWQLSRLPAQVSKRIELAQARASDERIRALGRTYATILERNQASQLSAASTQSTPLRRELPDTASPALSEPLFRHSNNKASRHSNLNGSRPSSPATPPRFRFSVFI